MKTKPNIDLNINSKELIAKAKKIDKEVFSVRFERAVFEDFKKVCVDLNAHHTVILEEFMKEFCKRNR